MKTIPAPATAALSFHRARSRATHLLASAARRDTLARLLAVILLLITSLAHGATITVNSTADPAGFNPNITVVQLSATVTLRDAVNAANNTAGDDEIVFAPGLAGQTIILSEVGLATTPDPQRSALNISSTVAIRGPVGGVTILKDGNVYPLRLINVSANGNLTVEGLILQGGAEKIGGGILNSGALTVRSSTIRDCISQGANVPGFERGAGVYNTGTLTVTGSTFSDNRATTSGAAIYSAAGSLTVSNTVFNNNRAWTSGGAITSLDNGGLSAVSGCTFTGNRVDGLLGADQNDGFGGAIRNRGVLAVTSSTFDGNLSQAGFNGGAICNSGTLNLSGSTFVRNIVYNGLNGASYGGGIENLNQATVTNCTFTQNLAYEGTAIDHRGASLALNHCTIVAQQAPTNGGAAVSLNAGGATFTNTIICRNYWFSTFYNENRPRNVSGGFSGSNNLIDNESPGVGDLGDNGGPTQTMPLVSTSPALNAGIATAGVTADQRGIARPQGAAVDIGAYEYGVASPNFTTPTATSFFIGTTNQFQVGATGLPVPTFSASGALPAGVTFTSSGLLSGSPAAGTQGSYPLTFTAVNPSGQVTQQFVLTVIQTDLIVTTAVDEDDGSINPALGTGTSLHEASNRAISLGGSQTIIFSPALAGQTIWCTINQGFGDGPSSFRVTSNVTIQGLTGNQGITLARGVAGDMRAFEVFGATLTLNDLTLAHWSSPYGAAILHGSSVRLNRCTVRDNFGDGIIRAGGFADATLENCTVVNNGGGYAMACNGFYTLRHTTVTGNTGGGLRVSNNGATLVNSIVAGNTNNVSAEAADFPYSFLRSGSGNNLIGTGVSSGFLSLYNGVNGNMVGVAANQLYLGPLADNGGPTQTVALLRNSPAIDRGSAGVVATDQRGVARPQLGAADIGAFEFAPTPSFVVTTPADENDGSSDPAYGTGTSLREALAYAQSSFTNTGFGQGWTLNGPSASVSSPFGTLNDTLTITPATQGQANSAWLNQKVSVNSFTASFRYTQGAGTGGGDGFTLTFQNAGTGALGSAGGGLGYGGIGQSVAFAFNIYGGNPSGPGFAVYTNGNVTGTYTPVGNGVGLTNGQPVDITVAGNGTTVTLTMTQGANVFTTTFNNLNIASIVGSSSAYVGFTGATGGAVALQQISRFNLTAARAATITFAPALAGQTVTLANGWNDANDASALRVTENVTVQGLTSSPGVTIAMASGVEKRHILVHGSGRLTLSNLSFANGRGDFGGSIGNYGTLAVRGCTFTGNHATGDGGAIHSAADSPSLLIENSTFSGNSADFNSSAVATGAQQTTYRYLTITNNTGGSGAVMIYQYPTTMVNSIVAGNGTDGIIALNGASFTAQTTNNILGSGGSGGLVDGVNGNRVGVPAAALNLGTLGDNGGPTKTIALLGGGPAIDGGVLIAGITGDQRGTNRPQGAAPDIGAFEFVQTAAAIPVIGPPGGAYATSVRVSIGSSSPGTIVRYTLDGSTPTTSNGTTYAGPFTLTTSATVKAIAVGGGWLESAVASVAYTVLSPLPSWRALHGLPSDGAQDVATPAGDGVANLLKYAFNMAPNLGDLSIPNVGVLPANGTAGLPFITRNAQGRLFIEFIRRKAATNPGLAYVVETGADLTNLTPLDLSGASVVSIDTMWERVTVIEPTITPQRFGRVRLLVFSPYVNDFNAGLGAASLRGSAVWTSGAVKLTDEVTGGSGAVVFDGIIANPALNGFTARFNLALGPISSGIPADGASFAVGDLGTGVWGETGPGTARSLAVGFDTYNNGSTEGNIGIHVWVNGTHVAVDATNPYTNGISVPVEISYDTPTGVTVRFNGVTIFNNVATPGFAFPLNGRFGLGARTGGSTERAVVDDIEITPR